MFADSFDTASNAAANLSFPIPAVANLPPSLSLGAAASPAPSPLNSAHMDTVVSSPPTDTLNLSGMSDAVPPPDAVHVGVDVNVDVDVNMPVIENSSPMAMAMSSTSSPPQLLLPTMPLVKSELVEMINVLSPDICCRERRMRRIQHRRLARRKAPPARPTRSAAVRDPSAINRRAARVIRNREVALRARQKQKALMKSLESENCNLRTKATTLEEENYKLRTQIEDLQGSSFLELHGGLSSMNSSPST